MTPPTEVKAAVERPQDAIAEAIVFLRARTKDHTDTSEPNIPVHYIRTVLLALSQATEENERLRGLRPVVGEEFASLVRAHMATFKAGMTEAVQAVRAGWHPDADWQNAAEHGEVHAALHQPHQLEGSPRTHRGGSRRPPLPLCSRGRVMGKLTTAQRELLDEISNRESNLSNSYAPAKKLVALGFASWREGRFGATYLVITDAGRAALSGEA